MNGLFEILSNKEWMIQQEFLHSILPTLQYNITNHASLGIDREKKSPMAIGQQGQDFIREYQVTQDGEVKPVYDAWGEGDVLGKMLMMLLGVDVAREDEELRPPRAQTCQKRTPCVRLRFDGL